MKQLFLALALIMLGLPSEPSRADDTLTLVHAGTLMTTSEAPLLKAKTIVIRGHLIEEIRDGYMMPEDLGSAKPTARIVDLRESFVSPGFIDSHVHMTHSHDPDGRLPAVKSTEADLAIIAALSARKIVEAGFTTVMDLGTGARAHEKAIYATRDAIARGQIKGPEILAAGSPISAVGFSRTGKYNDSVEEVIGPQGTCHDSSSCRFRVLEQIRRGADFINVYNTGSLLSDPSPAQTLPTETLEAIQDTAALLGYVTIADGGNSTKSASGVNNAIRAGFRIIDTVTYPDQDTFDLLKEAGGYFSPHVYALEAAVGDSAETLRQGSMGWLPLPLLKKLYVLKQQTPSALAAYKAGVDLILGSDSGVFPHGDNPQELISYVKLGIPASDALMAATINAAKAFGIDHRTGSIAPGKEADIVAFRENPLQDIQTVLRPLMVMSDGKIQSLMLDPSADGS